MLPPPSTLKAWRLALLAVVLVGGCAGLPRIDPSGRRILIWPEATSAPQAQLPSLPSLPQLGNIDVPPVVAGQAPIVAPPEPTGPSVFGTPVPQTVMAARVGADEELKITPSRLLAPVGSEVILKAGVCNRDGYLRTNRRIEWMLGQEGAGQFVTVGNRGEMDFMRLPWERPNKVDNSYAVGYTAPFHTCLRRGTEDTTDDVQVRPGEAWITVSSASEGVSYVTATAPGSENWNARRATATVYWVDAQWQIPGPQQLQLGQAGTLITTVTRATDGAPVQGWLVRYEVLRGETARLGYESGQVSEAETDSSGRASVQISPTDDQPGTALVKVTVIRPAMSAPMASPRLEVGGGEALITWSPAAVPAPSLPPADDRADTQTPVPPAPFEPPPRGNDGPPIVAPQPGIGPRVEIVLRRATTGPLRVGDPIPVTIELLNTGDAPAENLKLIAEYDRGLSSPQDRQGLYRLEYPSNRLPDLGPGDSSVVDLDFAAVSPGQQCYSVSVEATGMDAAFERDCFTIEQPLPPARPQLRIESALDAVREVGQKLNYIVTIYNDGADLAENVAVEILADPQLAQLAATDGWRQVEKGFRWEGQTIPAGGSIRFDVEFDCVAASDQAKVTTYALITESDFEQKTDAVEILNAQQPPPAATSAPLEGVLSSVANPARVGQGATLNVAVRNTTSQPIENVQYRLRFDPRIQVTAPVGAELNQGTLEFQPIPVLAAGETRRFSLTYTPVEQGLSTVYLDMRVGGSGEAYTEQETISIRPR